jgi:uncharacterized membrane protein
MTETARIPALDIARTAALGAMVVYHFTFDLAMFGFVRPDLPVSGFWALFARATAGSFLFLAGVSLWLAHGQGIRWHAFWRRFAVIAAAATLVSGATYVAMPGVFVFFGILHSIALSTLVALAFLRLPASVTLAAAIAVFATSYAYQHPAFDTRWLAWIGFAHKPPPAIDFEPLFPWLAPCLAGLALARWADRAGLLVRLRRPATARERLLSWPGQHSLAIYLIHQPILIGLVWSLVQVRG